jgi:hypothetical protein
VSLSKSSTRELGILRPHYLSPPWYLVHSPSYKVNTTLMSSSAFGITLIFSFFFFLY